MTNNMVWAIQSATYPCIAGIMRQSGAERGAGCVASNGELCILCPRQMLETSILNETRALGPGRRLPSVPGLCLEEEIRNG